MLYCDYLTPYALRLKPLTLSHYVVGVIDHPYQYILDQVIYLLDDRVTAVRPNDGRSPNGA